MYINFFFISFFWQRETAGKYLSIRCINFWHSTIKAHLFEIFQLFAQICLLNIVWVSEANMNPYLNTFWIARHLRIHTHTSTHRYTNYFSMPISYVIWWTFEPLAFLFFCCWIFSTAVEYSSYLLFLIINSWVNKHIKGKVLVILMSMTNLLLILFIQIFIHT